MARESFWGELVRRKVVKVAISYIAVAWILIQVADVALESFAAPEYFMQAFMLFAVLGVPIALILSWGLEITPSGIRREKASPSSIADLRQAIAVLPFANMSSDQEVEHMADGLSDNIITGCQQQLAIDVTSRNSTFVYKNQPVTITNVANELNVAYVLEGSIQKQADTLRITAQLINASDDSHLWADHFDRTLDDAFSLQDELTETIVAEIKRVLSRPVEDKDEISEAGFIRTVMKLPSIVLFTAVGIVSLGVLLAVLALLPGAGALTGLSGGISFEMLGGAILIATLAGLFLYYLVHRNRTSSIDVAQTLTQIEDHVQHNQFAEAFDLAIGIEGQLDTEVCDRQWWDSFSYVGSLETEPEGARVHWRPYNGRNVPWRDLGNAPVRDLRLPLGSLQVQLKHPGYVTQEFAIANRSVQLGNQIFTGADLDGIAEARILAISRTHEDGMVFARERMTLLSLNGMPFRGPTEVRSFFIDKHPVSNEAFKQFVDAGGYAKHEYWRDLPWPAGTDWEHEMGQFLDKTEQAGPASWELGRYPDGEGGLPVTGLSWFEAAAYAKSVGKRLPTVDEWARAALPVDAGTTPISVAMMYYSNFLGKGKSAPGDFPALNAIGTYDMFGNVREWAWNEVGDGRSNLGGCDTDLAYFAVWLNSENPFLRDDSHGFRCAKGDADPAQLEKIDRLDRTYAGEEPVKGDVYDALVQGLVPRKQPTRFELMEETEIFSGLNLQQYRIDSGYQERIPLLMVKGASTEPSPALVVFPGMGSFMGTSGETDAIDLASRLDFIVTQLGYSLILPNWSGAFERFDGGPFPQGEGINTRSLWMERIGHWVQEACQAMTFAEEHDDIDGERVGFLGISYGANNTIPVLALEKRFKTALLFSGNLMSHPMFPFADSLNFYPHVFLPTLFVNGRYDTIVSSNEALFDRRMMWLGTPEEHKKQVLYDAGHWPFPQHLFKKEVADWLKTYL